MALESGEAEMRIVLNVNGTVYTNGVSLPRGFGGKDVEEAEREFHLLVLSLVDVRNRLNPS